VATAGFPGKNRRRKYVRVAKHRIGVRRGSEEMKCPDCKATMEFQGYPHHKYEYYSCKNCGTEIRIIHGREVKK